MAERKRKKKIDHDDVIDILPVVPTGDASPGELLPVAEEDRMPAVDRIAAEMAVVEDKARQVAVDARKKDLETIQEIEGVTKDMLEGFKGIDWQEIIQNKPKDAAIAYGILMDKREKLLSYDAARPSNRRKRGGVKFEFNFSEQKATVTVEDGGEE